MKTTRNQRQAAQSGTTGAMRRKVWGVAFAGLALCATLDFTAPSAQAQTAQLKVFGQTTYVHGVNIAWIQNSQGSNYGHDLGYNYVTGYNANFNKDEVRAYFSDIKRMHCNVARVWLFEGMEGLKLDSYGKVSGVDSGFKSNLNSLMYAAILENVAVQLCLVSHDLNEQFGQPVRGDGSGVTGGAPIRNFVTDASAQQAFLDNAVNPIIKECLTWSNGGVKSSLFGIDIVNEPQWAVRPYSGKPPVCNWSQMHDFLYNVARRIHSLEGSIQVGCDGSEEEFRSENHWSRLGGVGLDYYAYHEYSNAPNLPDFRSSRYTVDKPILLGEFNASNSTNQSEDIKGAAISSYITQARDKGYAGSVVWSYRPIGYPDLGITDNGGAWRLGANKMNYWGIQFGT